RAAPSANEYGRYLQRRTPQRGVPTRNALSPFGDEEIELLLLRPRQRGGRGRQGMAQGAQDAKAALHSIGPDGVGDSEQIAARIMSFVSFHGAIIKQGVG